MGSTIHTNESTRLYAWSDESGNSGLNLFDPDQPIFWSGTLLSPSDLDRDLSHLQKWKAAVQADKLHGKLLSFDLLNKISLPIRDYLDLNECRFVFTRIDKEFHAIATLVALLFDSEINTAVEPFHDYVPIFRKQIVNDVIQLCSRRDRRRFWDSYRARDLNQICDFLLTLELRASETWPDQREVEVFCEACRWARSYPRLIMESGMSNQDSPNLRALILLIDGVQKIAGDQAKIVRFRHDEQPEFGETLAADFKVLKNVRGPLGNLYAAMQPRTLELFDCELEMVSSKTSPGLQLIDVVLYLMSRHLNGLYAPRKDACGTLLDYLRSEDRAIINQILYTPQKDFDFEELESIALRSSLFDSKAPSFDSLIQDELSRRTNL